MWKTGEEIMPPYGETVMYKLAKGKKIQEGIGYLLKTDGNGHHFEKIADIKSSVNGTQPYFSFVEDGSFDFEDSEKNLFVWYDMVPLNKAGLSQAELIKQPKED